MDNRRQPPGFGFSGARASGPAADLNAEPSARLTIDMTAEGEMMPPRGAGLPLTMRIGAIAVIVAVAAALAVLAAVFLWLATILIPVALVAGLVAYAAFRLQGWRVKSRGGRRAGWVPAAGVRRFRP